MQCAPWSWQYEDGHIDNKINDREMHYKADNGKDIRNPVLAESKQQEMKKYCKSYKSLKILGLGPELTACRI